MREKITELCNAKAQVAVFEERALISLEYLDNRLARLKEIRLQIEQETDLTHHIG